MKKLKPHFAVSAPRNYLFLTNSLMFAMCVFAISLFCALPVSGAQTDIVGPTETENNRNPGIGFAERLFLSLLRHPAFRLAQEMIRKPVEGSGYLRHLIYERLFARSNFRSTFLK